MQADAEDATLDEDVELDAVQEVDAGQQSSTLEHDATEGLLAEDMLQTTHVAEDHSELSMRDVNSTKRQEANRNRAHLI